MNLKESLSLSAANVGRHKLRSILTTLGIIIGVAAVIAMVTLAASFQAYFTQAFSGTFSPSAFTIDTGLTKNSVAGGGIYTADLPVFTQGDLEQIEAIQGVKMVVPFGGIPLNSVDGGLSNGKPIVTLEGVYLVATTPDALTNGLVNLQSGRGFTGPSEIVVGSAVAEAISKNFGLNGTQAAIGKTVELRFATGANRNLTVVGVLTEVPYTGFDYQMLVDTNPYYNATLTVPGTNQSSEVYSSITVSVASLSDVTQVQNRVMDYLNGTSDAHKILESESPGFGFIVISKQSILSFIQTQLSTFAAFVVSIGVVSLLVGSIGISNIMLVSMTERTREIGVMKALGARKRDILQLFVIEASVMSVIGAAAGVAVGVGLGALISKSGLFAGVALPLTLDPIWFPIAIGIGLLVGIASGLYPAWRAARVSPMEALRYE
jgi:putative ABC transport system permease protein